MNSLIIETSTPVTAVGIASIGELNAAVKFNLQKKHTELLIPAIDFLLKSTGLTPADIQKVVVDIGPGLFTGLRVGIATAKMFAWSKGIDLIAVKSLDAIAYAASLSGHNKIAVVQKARGKEVFFAFYSYENNDLKTFISPRVVSIKEAISNSLKFLEQDKVSVFGNAVEDFKSELYESTVCFEIFPVLSSPPISSIAKLALNDSYSKRWEPELLEPLYLRPPDARINWQQRSFKDEN